ncbi:MAG: sigma-54-dependent Fis family transcriptional regulator [Deltaproteobacteria bacterium]|nr:sigma-54-dependent Fis family transcriptional regulator [Deltaproteobacteria bacterium]MBI3079751.1 sigma-54-dependent Fis family transcriptional regulator [Deltaproteobacteria bacterium]
MKDILIVERDQALRQRLREFFTGLGYDAEEAAEATEAVERLEKAECKLVIADLEEPLEMGLALLRRVREINPQIPVIFMTSHATVEGAVEVIKEGATDYVQRPPVLEELRLKAERALDHHQLQYEVAYLRHERNLIYRFDDIIGENLEMQRLKEVLRKVAPTNANVLIQGETGTGKELIAGAIHYNSPRHDKNFVCVNCAALHENLLETELFGHEKGAFTGAYKQRIGRFEQADLGTMFLDEIGDMSLGTQAKVLRVIEGHGFERLGGSRSIRVDVRVLAATNKDLLDLIGRSLFREDLYYRLNVVGVQVPPLRERRDDIPRLATYLLRKCGAALKRRLTGLHPDAMKLLVEYDWPGNVRELENTIERAVILCEGEQVLPGDLTLGPGRPVRGRPPGEEPAAPALGGEVRLAALERRAIVAALERANFVQKDAARLLGVSSRVLSYKIDKYGLDMPRRRRSAPGEP